VGAKVPSLRCAAWNIKRGFVIREAELRHLIESENLDIISISETDLYYQTEPPRIEGFKSIPTLRSSLKQKVRLMTLVKNSLADAITVRLDLMSEDFPSVWIEVQGLLVGSVYREWGKLQNVKLEVLLDQIQAASSSNKNVIVMGDFNLDQLKWDNPEWPHFRLAERLRDVVAQCGLEPIPMGPTYCAHQRSKDGTFASSALDHVYCSTRRPVKTRVLSSSASDHQPIMVEVDLNRKATKKMTIQTRRTFKFFNNEAFKYDLLQQRLETIPECGGVDDMVEALETMITSVLDIHAPFREVKHRAAFKSGLSTGTRSLMRQRDKLNSKMRHLKGDQKLSVHLEYKKARNRCSTLQRNDT
jgi:hypothetical protein